VKSCGRRLLLLVVIARVSVSREESLRRDLVHCSMQIHRSHRKLFAYALLDRHTTLRFICGATISTLRFTNRPVWKLYAVIIIVSVSHTFPTARSYTKGMHPV